MSAFPLAGCSAGGGDQTAPPAIPAPTQEDSESDAETADNQEADSIRVGSDATMTIWPETDFQGTSTTLDPGSEHPDLEYGPSSAKMTC